MKGPTSLSRYGANPGDCHYEPSAIPHYQAWARQFVLCDHSFGELMAPSVPNYFRLMGAVAPVLSNPTNYKGQFTELSLIDRLDAKQISWKNYDGGIPLVTMFRSAKDHPNVVPLSQLAVDAAAGQLPSVSWVTPALADSEHPPYSVAHGEAWTARYVETLMRSPSWPDTAIFIVWNEWGGFDDHVKPPVVAEEGLFRSRLRFGYRVPCLVLSPHAKRGFVSHTLYSHASIVRTLCRLFAMESLTKADAAANDMLDCFAFSM